MIPEKRKTPEEIAALREGLGIPGSPEAPPAKQETPAPVQTDPKEIEQKNPERHRAAGEPDEPVLHLNVPLLPVSPTPHQAHRLRRNDIPLAPAPAVTRKTALPTHRHDPRDIAQIRKREALAKLQAPGMDPAMHLRSQTAGPLLYLPGYLLALAAGAVAIQRVHHITPIVLLALALLVTLYIATRKPRSRHHAAFIFVLVFLTAAFGAIHYAPLFKHGP